MRLHANRSSPIQQPVFGGKREPEYTVARLSESPIRQKLSRLSMHGIFASRNKLQALLLIVSLITLVAAANSQPQSPASVREKPVNQWHHRTATVAETPQSEPEKQLWETRGRMFDHDFGAPYPLDNPIAATAFSVATSKGGIVEDRYFLTNPLPAKDSDVVVTATFADSIVRLSPSKRSLYSVLHFQVERVFKSNVPAVMPGAQLDVLVGGGSVSLNGRTVNFRLDAGRDTPLNEHHRYLLFLKYTPQSQSFNILKHWELENGAAIAVDLLEKRRASQGKSDFDGRSENELLAAAEDAIQSEGRIR